MTGGDRGRFKFKGEDEWGLGLGLKFGAKISHKVTSASKQMLSQRDREFSPLICELQARWHDLLQRLIWYLLLKMVIIISIYAHVHMHVLCLGLWYDS